MALAETRLSATEDVSSDTWVALSMRTWRRSFLLDFRAHCPWHALPLTDQASLFVLPTVQLHGEGAAVSDDYLVPLHEYIESIPSLPPPKESEQRARAPSGTDKGELLRKCPWLEQRLRSSPGPGAAAAPRAPGAKAPPKVGYDYTDAEVEEIFNLLHNKRKEWEEAVGDSGADDFAATVLGGPWCLAHKGRPFDAGQGCARSEAAKLFCDRYNLRKSSKWDIDAHGEDDARTLSYAWCHKMQWLLNCYRASDDPNATFRQADMEGYQEPVAFAAIFHTLTGDALRRATLFRNILPSPVAA